MSRMENNTSEGCGVMDSVLYVTLQKHGRISLTFFNHYSPISTLLFFLG